MREWKKLKPPIGIENFEDIRREGFYYVDKTVMIRDLLQNWGKVNLFTRPRRFGKSLNMSMLQTFLEIGCDRTLFDGLEITREKELCETYMGKFPVISISLKNVYGLDFSSARSLLCSLIGKEALRFSFLADSSRLTLPEKEMYRKITRINPGYGDNFSFSDEVLLGSLKTLSSLLFRHYGQKAILLIDEYDVPLAKANENGYYDQMANLIRSLFDQTLKTNDSLYFSVLTGCLRVAKESIFTGLNNLRVLSVSDVQFDEYFGFTDAEVRAMLAYYGISDTYENVKEWYDGYHFGNVSVYCPWDVINYCDKRKDDPTLYPESYWINTSGNDVIRHLLTMATAVTRNEIEKLIAGESISKEIRDELTYKDLYSSIENIWSVLYTTGYLTRRSRPNPRNRNFLELEIPNEEIRSIFITQIQDWMQDVARKNPQELELFCRAFQDGDARTAEKIFSSYLERTISIRDTAVRKDLKENFYHGFLLGLLSYKHDWLVLSNRESGGGYADIQVEIFPEKIGIIIEMKYASQNDLEFSCREALQQISKRDYTAQLREDGMETILRYGIACSRKKCRVMVER